MRRPLTVQELIEQLEAFPPYRYVQAQGVGVVDVWEATDEIGVIQAVQIGDKDASTSACDGSCGTW